MPPWIPNFLNWQTGLIAAGIVIPSLLILYFLKLRRREMPVSSTLLWRKAIQDLQVNAPFQKLRRNLLLLLQMLLLLLLLAALARPVANYTPGPGKTTHIMIDRSASMSAKDIDEGKRTRLDEAKRRAKEMVDAMPKDGEALVIAFDDSADLVHPLSGDRTALKRAIDSIEPTDRKSRIKMAYQLSDARLFFDPAQNRANAPMPDIRVFSDGRLQDESDVTVQGEITLERIGTDTAGNIAIVALSAKRNYENPLQLQVFTRLANYGPEPVETFVEFSVDGKQLELAGDATVRKLLLLPERWSAEKRMEWQQQTGKASPDAVDLPLELSDAAIIHVHHTRKEGDVLSADDQASIVVPPPKNLSVALVTDGNYFLEKALTVLKLKDPVTMDPASYEKKAAAGELTGFDVFIFDRYTPQKLDPQQPGSFIYFGAIPNGLKLTPKLDEAKRYTILTDMNVLDWRRDHPLFKDLTMNKLFVGEAIKMDVPIDSEVLLDGMKCPLVALHREGKQTHMVVAFDVMQSNWPLLPSFPKFMRRAVQFLAVGTEMDVRQSFEPGANPRIAKALMQKATGAVPEKIKLIGPNDEKMLAVPQANDLALPPLNHVGVYKTDPPIPPYDRMAVNLLDPIESDLRPGETLVGGVAKVQDAARTQSRLELWWWVIACAALPLLLIEWWVYTRRVHI